MPKYKPGYTFSVYNSLPTLRELDTDFMSAYRTIVDGEVVYVAYSLDDVPECARDFVTKLDRITALNVIDLLQRTADVEYDPIEHEELRTWYRRLHPQKDGTLRATVKTEDYKIMSNYAQEAWDATKDATDAAYDQTEIEFRGKLDFAAERAIATGIANTPFEKKVVELAKEKDAEDSEHPLHVGVLSNTEEEAGEKRSAFETNVKRVETGHADSKRSTPTPKMEKPESDPNLTTQDKEVVAKEGVKVAPKPEPAKAEKTKPKK